MAFQLLDPTQSFIEGQAAAGQRQTQALQNATGQVGLLGKLQEMQQQQQLRSALAQSGGDLSKAIPALIQSGNIQGAVHLGELVKQQQAIAQSQRVSDWRASAPQFMTGGQPEIPPQSDELGGGPGRAAIPGQLDFNKFLQAGAVAGAVNPEVYANHQATQEATKARLAQSAQSALQTFQFHMLTAKNTADRDKATELYRNAQLEIKRQEMDPFGMIGRTQSPQTTPALPSVPAPDSGQFPSTTASLQAPPNTDLAREQANLATIDSEIKLAGTDQRKLGILNQERQAVAGKIQSLQSQPTETPGVTSPPAEGLHGEEFLKTLNPALATQIKGYAEGRIAFPSGFALKAPYFQAMLRAIGQYDPSFDQVDYNKRNRTATDAATGTMSKSNNALNTGIGHLAQLSNMVDPLGNVDITAANAVKNYVGQHFLGSTGKTNFDAVAARVAPEITRIWRGSGGAEADIKRDLDTLSSSAAPQQLHEAIANIAGLMESKLEANTKQYQQGMGTTGSGYNAITKENKKLLDVLSGRAGSNALPAGLPDKSSIDAELKRRGKL